MSRRATTPASPAEITQVDLDSVLSSMGDAADDINLATSILNDLVRMEECDRIQPIDNRAASLLRAARRYIKDIEEIATILTDYEVSTAQQGDVA
jgi:DNA repair ATPase RecN